MSFYIVKASGEKEEFNLKKFKKSLTQAGASPQLIEHIISQIINMHPQTTQEIRDYAIGILNKKNLPTAARYNLKQALIDLGPAGFPFEKFIAHLLEAQGYQTKTNQTVSGKCITYEIDIVAEKNNKNYIVECKFHNQRGVKSDVKTVLYNKARFDDIYQTWPQDLLEKNKYHHSWMITNTKFTTVAIQYAECVGLQLTSWSYPETASLYTLIDRFGLHPITALTSLTSTQKNAFISEGFVLCRDAIKYTHVLKNLGFSDTKIANFVLQARSVCRLNK
jgi:Holliday junction resolvase-like predicted endonuclease